MSDKAKDDKSAKPDAKAGGKPDAKAGGKPGSESKPGSKEAGNKGPSRARRIGIAALVVLALLGIAFLGGWLEGRGAMTEWRDRAQTAERLQTIYETRHELDEAWHAIEGDNFGKARTHVGEAAKVLSKGPKDEDITKLAKELADVQIVVTDDPSTQQEKLRAYMKRLDQMAEGGSEEAEGS